MTQHSRACRGAVAGLAAVALTGLAACGTTQAGPGGGASPQAAAGAGLCASAARVHQVAVRRAPGPSQGTPRPAQPGEIRVADPAKARALARALCGLPAQRHAPVNCPADFGGAISLVFTAGGHSFPAVHVRTSGCRTVTGLGPARVAGASFWRVLVVVLGPPPVSGAPS